MAQDAPLRPGPLRRRNQKSTQREVLSDGWRACALERCEPSRGSRELETSVWSVFFWRKNNQACCFVALERHGRSAATILTVGVRQRPKGPMSVRREPHRGQRHGQAAPEAFERGGSLQPDAAVLQPLAHDRVASQDEGQRCRRLDQDLSGHQQLRGAVTTCVRFALTDLVMRILYHLISWCGQCCAVAGEGLPYRCGGRDRPSACREDGLVPHLAPRFCQNPPFLSRCSVSRHLASGRYRCPSKRHAGRESESGQQTGVAQILCQMPVAARF